MELARALHERGTVIYATGGTKQYLQDHGVPAQDVGEMTGFPPLFDGRVKTLHPKVFGAILYDRDNPDHQTQAEKYAIAPITTVAANLYPFEATVAKGGTTHAEAIEQIDIGGVSLLRAAAKNFDHVAVLTHPSQYEKFIAALEAGTVPTQMRREFAIAAFERTAEYDAAIAHYLATEGSVLPSDLPGALTVTLPLDAALTLWNESAKSCRILSRRVRTVCPNNCTARRFRTIICSIWTRRCDCSRAHRWARPLAASTNVSCAQQW